MSGWENPYLTLRELAAYARVRYEWLLEAAEADPPLPTRRRGKVSKVLYSDFLEWDLENYGPDGPLRGSEDFAAKPRRRRAGGDG